MEKKIIPLILCMILLVGTISALEFDNAISNYDKETEIITFSNGCLFNIGWSCMGEDIGSVQLKTPKEFKVSRGYNYVWELDVELNQEKDYNDFIKGFEFEDLSHGKEKIDRKIDIKILTYEDVSVNDYEDVVIGYEPNGTKIKEYQVIGSHIETQEVLTKVTPANIKKADGKITLRGYTNVRKEDNIDWSPLIFGVRVSHDIWATWTESMNVGLLHYYALEQSTGTNVLDTAGEAFGNQANGTILTGTAWTSVSKIGGGLNSTLTGGGFFNLSNGDALVSNTLHTFNFWFKGNSLETSRILLGTNTGDDYNLEINSNAIGMRIGGSIRYTTGAGDYDWTKWNMYTILSNASGTFGYINNTYIGTFNAHAGAITTLYFGNDGRLTYAPIGMMDEVGIWNRTLSESEITDLYNSGTGITYSANAPVVTLVLPINYFNSTSKTVVFNWSALDTGGTVENTTLWIDEVVNQTITHGTSNYTSEQISLDLADGTYNWTVTSVDDLGGEGATSNRILIVDTLVPEITINLPTTILDYGYGGGNENLNWTIVEANVDEIWYEYNGTNTTVYGNINKTTFALEENNYTLTLYVKDLIGNTVSKNINWSYKIFENSRTHSSLVYETDYETYSIDVTANSSLTTMGLNYNGTNYTMSNSGGGVWSYSRDLPENTLGNNSVNFKFTYGGGNIDSSYTTYQQVNKTIFDFCNTTNAFPFINFTFKDEADLTYINASIPTSTFEYYLGNGGTTKTLTFVNNSDNPSYAFCGTPTNRTLYVDPYMQYKQGSSYPQRIYDASVLSLTNDTLNKLLYLLGTADGIYVTFQTLTVASVPIEKVDIVGTRTIESENVIVGTGITDGAGSVTFWLNPDFSHTFDFSKTGYSTVTQSIIPTQSSYTITMGATSNYTYISNLRGLMWAFFPRGKLEAEETYFGFNITDEYSSIVGCKIELLNNNKSTILATATTAATNSSKCSVQVAYTPNQNYPRMKGRLLVDIGDGYQILEEDAYWVFIPYETTGSTFMDFFNRTTNIDLKYFAGSDDSDEIKTQHREYTYILVFFLIVAIVCAVMNQAGWDIQTNGGMIFLMGCFIWIASVTGFLNLEGISPMTIVDKYFLALTYSMFMAGFALREFG